MKNGFTAIVERDGKWFIAYCPEIPGANGQGKTKAECLRSLSTAIDLILENRREDARKGAVAMLRITWTVLAVVVVAACIFVAGGCGPI